MKKVYFLVHFYENDDDNEYVTDIAVYSTREKAELAMAKFKKHKKFREHPCDFLIQEYKINEKKWQEGFFSWR